LLGPRRYTDLLRELPGITTNLLAKRLKEMESAGIVERDERPPPMPTTAYRLTALGLALEPVVMEIARWGGHLLQKRRRGDVLNIGWALLSMKRRYQGGVSRVIELQIDERRFELVFSPSYLSVQEREAARPEAVVTGGLTAFLALFFDGARLKDLRKQGQLAVSGSEPAAFEALRALGLDAGR
jgi:DNA-binding HxlR family transcriptional regulator